MHNSINKDNLLEIVVGGLKSRFQNISPFQFEKLIQLILKDYFADAYLTKKGGDFGGDVICINESGSKIVVQCKRYKKGSNVGNKYIDNVISSLIYYEAEKGIIITTSGFTKSAIEIAEKAGIELWDWYKLQDVLSSVLNEGEPLISLLKKDTIRVNTLDSILDIRFSSLESFWMQRGGKDLGKRGNFINFEIINKTSDVLQVDIEMPVIINKNRQYDIDSWWTGYFTNGVIFPRAIVTSGIIVEIDKVGDLANDTFSLFVEVKASIKGSNNVLTDHLEIKCSPELLEIEAPEAPEAPEAKISNSRKKIAKYSRERKPVFAWMIILVFIFSALFLMLVTSYL